MVISTITKFQKSIFLGAAGTMSAMFLGYNTSVSPITHRRYLNLFGENLREFGSKVLMETILSPFSYVPQSESAEPKNNRELLTSVLIQHFLQGKEVSHSFPAYDKLDEMAARLVENNPELKLTRPKIHISMDGSSPAFSLADHIVISLSTLMTCSETQIAFILGHEMAHNALDHHVVGLSLKTVDLMTFGITILMAPRKLLLALFWFVCDPLKPMLIFPVMRRAEDEADEVGLRMVVNAGYGKNISQVLDMWDKLEEERDPSPDWFHYFTDHPSLKHRKQRMKQQIVDIINNKNSKQ